MGTIKDKIEVHDYDLSYTDKLITYCDLLINSVKITINEVEIANGTAEFYKGDFSKLCTNELGIDLKYLPVILRLNGYKSSIDYDGATVVKTISPNVIDSFFKDNLN